MSVITKIIPREHSEMRMFCVLGTLFSGNTGPSTTENNRIQYITNCEEIEYACVSIEFGVPKTNLPSHVPKDSVLEPTDYF